MKKTIILSIVFCALFAYMPFAAQAADDPSISSVSVTPTSSDAGATETYTVQFTAANTLASGTTLSMYGVEPGGSGVLDFTNAVTSSSTIANHSFSTSMSGVVAEISLPGALAPGTWDITFTGVTNPSSDATLIFGVTTETPSENANITYDDDYILIGSGSPEEVEPITGIDFEAMSYIAGATTIGEFTITHTGLVPDDLFYIIFNDDQETAPDETGFDFSDATFSYTEGASNTSCELYNDVSSILQCTMGDDLEAGDFTIIATGMVMSAQVQDFGAALTTQEVSPNSTYYNSNQFSVSSLNTPKKKKVKMVFKKNGKHLLKYTGNNLNGNVFKVKLKGKKLKKKKYKKIKTFTVTKKKKRPKKSIFKGRNFVSVQWNNCERYDNDADTDVCSGFSKARKFKKLKKKFKLI